MTFKLKEGIQINSTLVVDSATKIYSSSTEQSVSKDSGSIVTEGGVGIEQNLYVGQLGRFLDTTPSGNAITGAVVISGGLGVGENINALGTIKTTNTTESVSIITGSIVTSGGVGIALNLNIGGVTHLWNTTQSISTATGALVVDGGLGVEQNAFIGGVATITDTTVATSTSTGALVVAGGVGVGGNLHVGGNLTINGSTTTINSTITSVEDPVFVLGGDASTPETVKDRGIEFKWAGVTVVPTNYITNGTTTVVATFASTTGRAIGDILTISGATGTEQTKLNGTWTVTALTATTLTFQIATAAATGTLTTGLGTLVISKDGFFGLDQSTGKFTFIPQALNSGEVFSGTPGDFVGKNFYAVGGEFVTQTSGGTSVSSEYVNSVTVTTTAVTSVDTFPTATYRSAKYIIQVTQGSNYQVSELLVIHNGTSTTMTEYAVLDFGTPIATFTSDVNAGSVRLLAQMVSATSATIKISRVALTV